LRERYGTRSFEFIEDTFTCMPDRILSLTGLLRSRDYECPARRRFRTLTEHPALLPSMVEAGCRGLFFGIESGNDEVLKRSSTCPKEDFGYDRSSQNQGVKHFVTASSSPPLGHAGAIADTLDLILELRARGAHTPVSILYLSPAVQSRNGRRSLVSPSTRSTGRLLLQPCVISTSNLCREELDEIYFSVIESVVATAGTADAVGEMSRSRLGGEVVTN